MFLSFCFHVAFVSFPVPFILLSCCICFLSRSFHVPFMLHLFPFSSFHFALISFHFAFISFHVPFILHSCPFIFRRYVSNIQVFEKWYAQTGQVGIRPKARFFFSIFVVYRFCYRLCVLENCAGCHLQGPSTCTCISPLLFVFYSYRFLGR
jgi:hypothetical protein